MYLLRCGDDRLLLTDQLSPELLEKSEVLAEVDIPSSERDELSRYFGQAADVSAIRWGDVVAWTTKRFGIEPCGQCRTRQLLLNQIKNIGFVNTWRVIAKTF